MIEGLVAILIVTFVAMVVGLITRINFSIVVLQMIGALITVYLLIRVRVKISKAEKENLRAKIEELQRKIETVGKI